MLISFGDDLIRPEKIDKSYTYGKIGITSKTKAQIVKVIINDRVSLLVSIPASMPIQEVVLDSLVDKFWSEFLEQHGVCSARELETRFEKWLRLEIKGISLVD